MEPKTMHAMVLPQSKSPALGIPVVVKIKFLLLSLRVEKSFKV